MGIQFMSESIPNQLPLAVINFVYFTANFPGLEFIEEIWPGLMAEHFKAKLLGISNRLNMGFISPESVIRFFFELDMENQMKLVQWVEENYHFSSFHK